MRLTLRSISTVAAAVSLTLGTTCAVYGAGPEHGLLGVQIWHSTWHDVLAKHGQPTRIVVGTPAPPTQGGAGGGMSMGGPPGMRGMPGMSSGGGMGVSGGVSGFGGKGGGGLPGLPGMGPNVSGMANSYSRMLGGAMGDQGEGEGTPGGFGQGAGPSMGSGMSAMGGTQQAAREPEQEVTWVYEHGNNTNYYLFNRDGRLIQVQSFGYSNGGVTSAGVRLGDTTAKIYRAYGWPQDLVKDDAHGAMELNYARRANVTIQLVDLHDGKGYRVVGITVGITKRSDIPGNRTGHGEDEAGD